MRSPGAPAPSVALVAALSLSSTALAGAPSVVTRAPNAGVPAESSNLWDSSAYIQETTCAAGAPANERCYTASVSANQELFLHVKRDTDNDGTPDTLVSAQPSSGGYAWEASVDGPSDSRGTIIGRDGVFRFTPKEGSSLGYTAATEAGQLPTYNLPTNDITVTGTSTSGAPLSIRVTVTVYPEANDACDGYGEFLPEFKPYAATASRAAYNTFFTPNTSVRTAADIRVVGNAAGDAYGSSFAVGDFNGDGLADLAVGAPGVDLDVDPREPAGAATNRRIASNVGAVYIHFGTETAKPWAPPTDAPGMTAAGTFSAAPGNFDDGVVLYGGAVGDRAGVALATLTWHGGPEAHDWLAIGAPGGASSSRPQLLDATTGAGRPEDLSRRVSNRAGRVYVLMPPGGVAAPTWIAAVDGLPLDYIAARKEREATDTTNSYVRMYSGELRDDNFGAYLASGGRVRADSNDAGTESDSDRDALIVGAHLADQVAKLGALTKTIRNVGRAYVVVPTPSADGVASVARQVDANFQPLAGDVVMTISGTRAEDQVGRGVASAGDWDGDGGSEIAVGGPGLDFGANGQSATGAYSSAGGVNIYRVGIPTAGTRWDITFEGRRTYTVGSATDASKFTGDGAVAQCSVDSSGVSYTCTEVNDSADAPIVTYRYRGELGAKAGFSVASAGELCTGGGVVIGAPAWSLRNAGTVTAAFKGVGAAYVACAPAANAVNTNPEELSSLIVLGEAALARGEIDAFVHGSFVNGQFGASVSGGDLNGDGIGDLVAGAPLVTVGSATKAGAAYFKYGPLPTSRAAIASEVSISETADHYYRENPFQTRADAILLGSKKNAVTGTTVAILPDINGDDFADLVVSAPKDVYEASFGPTTPSYGYFAGWYGGKDESDSVKRYTDADGDGYGNSSLLVQVCDDAVGTTSAYGGDCDDNATTGGSKTPTYYDPNCDGTPEFSDWDGDGIAAVAAAGADCDDRNAAVRPGAEELCNGLDDNCDNRIDNEGAVLGEFIAGTAYFPDNDGDGYGRRLLSSDPEQRFCSLVEAQTAIGIVSDNEDDCDDGTASNPAAWGLDAVPGTFSGTAAAYRALAAASRYPGAPESCASIAGVGGVLRDVDEDCDGVNDDSPQNNGQYGVAADLVNRFKDADGDTYGTMTGSNAVITVCPDETTAGYVASSNDCDDSRAAVFPGAPETCDYLDNDCSGAEYLGGASTLGASIGGNTPANAALVGAAGEGFGRGLIARGNFDSDAADEIVVSVPPSNGTLGTIYVLDASALQNGQVDDLLAGRADGTTSFLARIRPGQVAEDPNNPGAVAADAITERAEFGTAIAVGDFDGNGRDDIAVGAPGKGFTRSESGGVYVFLQPSSGFVKYPAVGSAFVMRGGEAGSNYGSALATLENASGPDSLVIGASGYDAPRGTVVAPGVTTETVMSNVGRVVVVNGSASFLPEDSTELSGTRIAASFVGGGARDTLPSGGNNLISTGEFTPSEGFGTGIAVGDSNNDGVPEIAVAAKAYKTARTGSSPNIEYYAQGRVRVLTNPTSLSLVAQINGTRLNDGLGGTLSYANIDGEDGDELLVGTENGVAYVFNHVTTPAGNGEAADGLAARIVVAGERRADDAAGFGRVARDRVSLRAAGDLNGDGFEDVLVAAPGHDLTTFDTASTVGDESGNDGAVFVVYGASSFMPAASGGIFQVSTGQGGNFSGESFGRVDGSFAAQPFYSGQNEVFSAQNAGTFEGAALFGRAQGDRFGSAVLGGLNLNGDANADFVAGAPGSDAARGTVQGTFTIPTDDTGTTGTDESSTERGALFTFLGGKYGTDVTSEVLTKINAKAGASGTADNTSAPLGYGSGLATWYTDADQDGYALAGSGFESCEMHIGWDNDKPLALREAYDVGAGTHYCLASNGTFTTTLASCPAGSTLTWSEWIADQTLGWDCGDTNAAQHPGATEIGPGNVDENCDGSKYPPQGQTVAGGCDFNFDGDASDAGEGGTCPSSFAPILGFASGARCGVPVRMPDTDGDGWADVEEGQSGLGSGDRDGRPYPTTLGCVNYSEFGTTRSDSNGKIYCERGNNTVPDLGNNNGVVEAGEDHWGQCARVSLSIGDAFSSGELTVGSNKVTLGIGAATR